jgi:hypothetical protein
MTATLAQPAVPEIYLTIDVEWAGREVVADTLQLLGERGLRATFFCTHAGIDVPGHERALHPNFRRQGDTLRGLRDSSRGSPGELSDEDVYRHVVGITKSFCPEAIGVRAHSLFYDFELLQLYRDADLQYDSSYFLPLASGLRPIRSALDLLEIPIYYMDYWDLLEGASGWRLEELDLERPGIKVFDFHPNLVFMNASSMASYLASKADYHDAERLLRLRQPERGVRTLFLELIDFIAARGLRTLGLGDLNDRWRALDGCASPVGAAGAEPPPLRSRSAHPRGEAPSR